MPEPGYAFGDQPALDELAQTDLLLDAIAERRPVRLDDLDDGMLTILLEDWRDNLRWPPASALVSPEEAIVALHTGLAERRRGRRGLAAIGSVAAALLVLSGFGAMVVEARPGDTLYGLHQMFFDQPKVNDNHIALSAKADLARVQDMIDRGQWEQAHDQLAEVSSTVQSLNDGADRHNLMDQLNLLNTRVESHNPNATMPPTGASTAPPVRTSKAPSPAATSSVAPPPALSPSQSPEPSPTPSSTRQHHHHHHGQTTSPAAPSTEP